MLPSAGARARLDQHLVQSGGGNAAIARAELPAVDPIGAALDDARGAWTADRDARELRRALLRVLADLEAAS